MTDRTEGEREFRKPCRHCQGKGWYELSYEGGKRKEKSECVFCHGSKFEYPDLEICLIRGTGKDCISLGFVGSGGTRIAGPKALPVANNVKETWVVEAREILEASGLNKILLSRERTVREEAEEKVIKELNEIANDLYPITKITDYDRVVDRWSEQRKSRAALKEKGDDGE